MNHNNYKELLQLYILDELNESQKLHLENHLLECNECSEELNSLRQLHSALTENKPVHPSERSLTEAREGLMKKIVFEENKIGFFESIVLWIRDNISPGYRFALGSVTALLVGMLLGYLVFSGTSRSSNHLPIDFTNVDDMMRNNYKLSNIRFDETPAVSGEEVEISFDAVRPVTIKGKMDEEFVKTLLTTALTTSENPGTRLRTINRIASNSSQYLGSDPKIKDALVTAMVSDENPGVRREALNVLMQYPIDEKIKEAFLSVLANDPNSGMRVSAINALVKLKLEGRSFDEEVTNTLAANAANDNNKFVQLRAAALLKEEK